jgi:hypothetical protein
VVQLKPSKLHTLTQLFQLVFTFHHQETLSRKPKNLKPPLSLQLSPPLKHQLLALLSPKTNQNNTSTTKRNITTTRNTIITIPILLVILNHQVIQIERSIIITKKILKKEMLIKKR